MTDLRARDLRNDMSGVLRRVRAGERLRVTLRGRPVAELVPVASRPRTMAADRFWHALESRRADVALLDELRRAIPDHTDDLETP